MGFFQKIKEGLQKTRSAMVQSMQKVVNSFTKIDEDLFEQLEETMIMGDMGVETSVEICDRLRKLVKERGVKDPSKIMDLIEEIIGEMMGDDTLKVAYYDYSFTYSGKVGQTRVPAQQAYAAVTPDYRVLTCVSDKRDLHKATGLVIPGYKELLDSFKETEEEQEQ